MLSGLFQRAGNLAPKMFRGSAMRRLSLRRMRAGRLYARPRERRRIAPALISPIIYADAEAKSSSIRKNMEYFDSNVSRRGIRQGSGGKENVSFPP